MTRREKLGIGILIALFAVLCAALAWILGPPKEHSFTPAESPIVRQRIINLEKSR